ncbi:MAG: hypothetical protein M1814_001354 [Vezdaea aestivalis]|nr:MAG: hypothetical protein M1814_001354 [Vezdaea aestivalis]
MAHMHQPGRRAGMPLDYDPYAGAMVPFNQYQPGVIGGVGGYPPNMYDPAIVGRPYVDYHGVYVDGMGPMLRHGSTIASQHMALGAATTAANTATAAATALTATITTLLATAGEVAMRTGRVGVGPRPIGSPVSSCDYGLYSPYQMMNPQMAYGAGIGMPIAYGQGMYGPAGQMYGSNGFAAGGRAGYVDDGSANGGYGLGNEFGMGSGRMGRDGTRYPGRSGMMGGMSDRMGMDGDRFVNGGGMVVDDYD